MSPKVIAVSKVVLYCSECEKEITGDSCPFCDCKNYCKPFKEGQRIRCLKDIDFHSCYKCEVKVKNGR